MAHSIGCRERKFRDRLLLNQRLLRILVTSPLKDNELDGQIILPIHSLTNSVMGNLIGKLRWIYWSMQGDLENINPSEYTSIPHPTEFTFHFIDESLNILCIQP